MKFRYIYLLILISLIFTLSTCDKDPASPDYQKEIVIFGFLWGDRYLTADHAIMVNYTRPIQGEYSLEGAAISNAVVTITDDSTGEVTTLKESDRPGFYCNENLLIKPKTSYTLNVQADGKQVSATTTVPPELILETDLRTDSVNYVYPKNLGFEKPVFLECENDEQMIYVDMYCNEHYTSAEIISPFREDHKFPESQEEYEGGDNGEPRHLSAFMMLKDLRTDFFPGEYVVFWYASMIVFYGSNTMQILAIDDNYHNYLYREHPVLSGGVDGGIGVFGSVCGEQFHLMVMKE